MGGECVGPLLAGSLYGSSRTGPFWFAVASSMLGGILILVVKGLQSTADITAQGTELDKGLLARTSKEELCVPREGVEDYVHTDVFAMPMSIARSRTMSSASL